MCSAVNITGVNGIMLCRKDKVGRGGGGREGEKNRDAFNHGGNQNNVTSNWLSIEMLFYTKGPSEQPQLSKAESHSLSKHTSGRAD